MQLSQSTATRSIFKLPSKQTCILLYSRETTRSTLLYGKTNKLKNRRNSLIFLNFHSQSEQRRHREYASRLEREKELQLENCAIKLQATEQECTRLRDEAVRLREQLDKLRAEKIRLEMALEEAQLDVERAREAERRTALGLLEANRALKNAEEEVALRIDAERKIDEMAQEMENLRARNKSKWFDQCYTIFVSILSFS